MESIAAFIITFLGGLLVNNIYGVASNRAYAGTIRVWKSLMRCIRKGVEQVNNDLQ